MILDLATLPGKSYSPYSTLDESRLQAPFYPCPWICQRIHSA
jgi:hypothetical protein